MAFQTLEEIELGQIKVSRQKTTVLSVSHIGASVVVTMFDVVNRVGGIAHVVLPESSLSNNSQSELPGKYADLGVPALVEAFLEEGGQIANTQVRMVGGAQLFNFGGGSGNILNIGSRNATAIRTAMSRHGLVIDVVDIGGNKARALQFAMVTGQVHVRTIGGPEVVL